MAAKVIPVPPHIDSQHMAEERVAFDLATQEFVANHDELLQQFPDQWIAVLMNPDEGRTVLSRADFDELCREIENRRLPLGRAYIRYLAKQPRIWFL